jgi:hypothetical protein
MKSPSTVHQSYARWFLTGLAVLIVLLGLPAAVWVGSQGENGAVLKESSPLASARNPDDSGIRKTRSSVRAEPGPRATHGAHQLKNFYLPPLDLSGITLKEALERLRAVYVQACRDSGEEPLPLVFILPPGVNPTLRVMTRSRTLESTMHLLAAASKLSVKRHGREFRFTTPPNGDGRVVNREFDIPFGINAADYLAEMGIILSPDTRVLSTPGSLILETANMADLAAGGSVALSLAMDPTVTVQLTARLAKLPAGTEWPHADQSLLSDAEIQSVMHGLATLKDVEMMTLPSVVAKPVVDAEINIICPMIARSGDPAGSFETHQLGVVLNSNLSPLGFGYQVKSDLSVTTGQLVPETGRAVITDQAGISCETFATDAGTIVKVQTHSDGSRTVLMVSPVRIDATGAPVRERE